MDSLNIIYAFFMSLFEQKLMNERSFGKFNPCLMQEETVKPYLLLQSLRSIIWAIHTTIFSGHSYPIELMWFAWYAGSILLNRPLFDKNITKQQSN